MGTLPNIEQLIDEDRIEEALSLITEYIIGNTEDDEAYFVRGKLKWRMQNYHEAITDFEHAVAINSESGAMQALELARDVFDFYNPDLLNP